MKITISSLIILFFTSAAFAATFTVTRIDDRNNACVTGDCSLREAVVSANNAAGDDVINFAASLSGQTISLNGTEIQVTTNVVINGLGANQLNIKGNVMTAGASRIFYTTGIVTITDVTLSNGAGGGQVLSGTGGAILAIGGTLSLNRVVVKNSISASSGGAGGVSIRSGTNHRIENSTFTGNSVPNFNLLAGNCGGLSFFDTSVSIINTTVSNNIVTGGGGGICFFSTAANIRNSTIAYNKATNTYDTPAPGNGGGILARDSTLNVGSSIIAKNTAYNFPEIRLDGTAALTSAGYNLIGDSTGDAANTQISITYQSTDILDTNPMFGAFQLYGGTVPTYGLLYASLAVDRGNSFGLNTDARGQSRPFDYPNIQNALGGDGADIGAFERQTSEVVRSSLFDFDSDTKADLSVFRPSNATWYLNKSTDGVTTITFGLNGDIIAPADYDGDGITDLAVFRPSTGVWYLQRSFLGFFAVQFGIDGDLPMPANFNGAGKAEIAIFRPSTGQWYQFGAANVTVFGLNGDVPVAGDYDGDGQADIAVFRPSNGTWYLSRSTAGSTAITFGASGDKPVPADYDGDGKTDLAVWRPSNGVWYVQQSTAGLSSTAFGINNDLPAPADFDGDGKDDLGIFRPSNRTWYLQQSAKGFTAIQFGVNGDKPIPNAFVP